MIFVSAIGADQPGMAHAVTQTLTAAGCNIEDATMTRLSGLFSMILVVTPPQGVSATEVQERLAPLRASHGLHLSCEPVENLPHATPTGPRYALSAYGPERSGLLAALTGVLAEQGVNITDVQTRVASQGAAYVMLFELELPPTLDPAALENALTHAAHPLGIHVTLRPVEEDTL